jgi:hypothetical protein
MGIVKQYQMAIAELGGCAHAKFWGKHNRAPDTDDAGDVAELMRTAERIMRPAGAGQKAYSGMPRARSSGGCGRAGNAGGVDEE